MCGGGGGGGGNSSWQDEQAAQIRDENRRRAEEEARRINATNQINSLYGKDGQDQGQNMDALRDLLGQQYNASNTAPTLGSGGGGGLLYSPINTGSKEDRLNDMLNGTSPNQLAAQAQAEGKYNQEMSAYNDARNSWIESELARSGGKYANAAEQGRQREAGYDQVRLNSLGLMMDDISNNKSDAERATKFGLARSGLFGGSVDIDEHRNLAEANQKSVINANQLADNQVERMRSDDEATRADLISKINAGLDGDSAALTAVERMKNNRNEAMTAPPSSLLNNLFASAGSFWNNYQYGQGYGQTQQQNRGGSSPYSSGSSGKLTGSY